MAVIALNTQYSPNRGKVFGGTVEDYDRVIREPWLARAIDKIRGGDETEKGRLPFMCPHFSEFKDNRRAQSCIIPEAFTWHTMVDIDDKEKVEGACEAALRLNMDEGSVWYHKLKLASYSARKKLHLFIEMPLGMTIHEAQVAYCKAIGVEADSDCETPERMIYLTDIRQEIYRSDDFLKPFSEEEIRERVEAMKGKAPFKRPETPTTPATPFPSFGHPFPVKGQGKTPNPPEGHPSPVEGEGDSNDPSSNPSNNPSSTPLSEPSQAALPSPSTGEGSGLGVAGVPSYLSIPYSSIISKYWELHNHGMEPVTSNRDMLTFELALNLRHICGFDETLMDKVIPCYDGFPQEQKMKCIRSAINEKRTQMPRKPRDVLEALRKEAMSPTAGMEGVQTVSAIDEIDEQNNMYYYDNLPKAVLVQGIKDSIEAAGKMLTMPALFAACPCIGANATNVELEVHGKFNYLGLNIFIAGEAASNKGQMDDVVFAWCSHQLTMAKMYEQQWEEWRNKKKLAKNKKEQPVEPILPKEWLPLNNTTANLAEELSRVDGRHAISFTQEADVVVQKWKSSVSDFSTMLRVAWDASRYDREAHSVDAVNVHIDRLKWNVIMCGTPDALYRVVGNNGCRDGFQTRLCVAMTPDNTYSRLDDKPARMTSIRKERIEQVASLLRLMSGRLSLPELEKKGREWLEEVRIHTMMNDDKTMARQRFRICINAQRMTCCLILAAVCDKLIKKHGVQGAENELKHHPELWMDMARRMQTQAFLKVFDLIADYLMDTTLYFFRSRIEAGVAAEDYNPKAQRNAGSRSRKGKNDTIFGLLGDTFTANDAFLQSAAIKGVGVTQNAVDMMLRNWIKQELIVAKDGRYVKVSVISH